MKAGDWCKEVGCGAGVMVDEGWASVLLPYPNEAGYAGSKLMGKLLRCSQCGASTVVV